VALRRLEGRWRLAGQRLAGSLKAVAGCHGLEADLGLQLDGLELSGNSLAARGELALGERLRLPFTAGHDLAAGAGTLTMRGSVEVEGPLGGALIGGWGKAYDVTAGALGVSAALAWPRNHGLGGTLQLDLGQLDAHYQDYRLSGVEGALVFSADDNGSWSLQPAELQIAGIDTGVELRDVATGVAWSDDLLTFQATTAQLLGGSLRLAPFAYRLSAGEADFVVDLMDVELARVLELEGGHISGTGSLDGTLPVQVRDHVPSVVAGRVQADAPGGVLRVSSALAGGAGQPGLDFALRALQDFRYGVLEADVGYSAAGDLTLAVHLEGRNPAIEGGRPIHYNVTVNENVPTLLRSLRLQSELTREIERRVTD
jgi:hypothetical protein